MPMTKILLANDGSEGAFKALGTAISLAKHYQAELHMICVEELPMLPASIDEVVEEREEANHRYEKVIERAQSLCYMQDAMNLVSGSLTRCPTLPKNQGENRGRNHRLTVVDPANAASQRL